MKKLVILSLLALPNLAFAADVDYYAAQKRYEAEQKKLQIMQQIQHTKANPYEYMNSLQAAQNQPVAISVKGDGHYYAPVEINGRKLEMMADTGASSIFLSQDDARKMGIATNNLSYNLTYNVAGGGTIKAAEIVLPSLKVGNIEMTNVPVSISEKGSGMSLLGMTFFQNLSKYEVQNGQLMLYK